MAGDFTPEQKRYLEGLASGLQVARMARGTQPTVTDGVREHEGPDAAHLAAQDRVLARHEKLSDPEKVKREERYHRMHVLAWIDRLARGGREARSRIEAALVAQEIDAPTVFTPLEGEAELLGAGILTRSMAEAEGAWRADLTTILVPLELALPPHIPLTPDGRRQHSDSFRWLWGEFTSVRRSEGQVTW